MLVDSPIVYGVMAVNDPRRVRMAQVAVNQFLRQTYRNVRLLIVNCTETPVTNREHSSVKEMKISGGPFSLAYLWWRGMCDVGEGWTVIVRDDEFIHPHRLVFQMAHRTISSRPVLLSHQMRIAASQNVLKVHTHEYGVPETALFYVRPTLLGKIDAKWDPFISHLLGAIGDPVTSVVLLKNDPSWFPGPALSLAFYHNLHDLTVGEFLGEHAGQEHAGKIPAGISNDVLDYVKHAMQVHGVQLKIE